jgi:hypothetical protein
LCFLSLSFDFFKALAQTATKLKKTPAPIIPACMFCKSSHSLELAKFALTDSLRRGTPTKASSPPAQRAMPRWIILPKPLFTEPLVKSNVKISGKIKSTRLRMPLLTLKLSWPVRFFKSTPAKLMTVKPAQSAKKEDAALLFNKNANTNGVNTNTAKITSAITLF